MLQPVRGVTSKHENSWISRHCVKSAVFSAVAPYVENLLTHECIADVLGVCFSHAREMVQNMGIPGYRGIVLSQPLSLAVAPCVENLRIHERIADVLGV